MKYIIISLILLLTAIGFFIYSDHPCRTTHIFHLDIEQFDNDKELAAITLNLREPVSVKAGDCFKFQIWQSISPEYELEGKK